MFTANITLTDNAAVSKTFNLISQTGQSTLRVDTASPTYSPRSMAIRHSSSGKEPNIVDRHNVIFTDVKTDVDGSSSTASVSITIAMPRNDNHTADDIKHLLLGFAVEFLTASNIDALLRGES